MRRIHLSTYTPGRRRTDASAQFLSIYLPPRGAVAPSALSLVASIYVVPRPVAVARAQICTRILFSAHHLTSPARRRTSLSAHFCGHVSYVTQHVRFSNGVRCGFGFRGFRGFLADAHEGVLFRRAVPWVWFGVRASPRGPAVGLN